MSAPLGELRLELRRALPGLALLALASGVANVYVVVTVTSALAGGELAQLADSFLVACAVYLLARLAVERRLIRLTTEAVYLTRARLLRQLLGTPFNEFERSDGGAVYTAICEDTTTLGNAAGLLATLVTSVVTVAAAFVYLLLLDPRLAALMGLVVAAISSAYALRTGHARGSYERARGSWDTFVRQLREALDGFKELSVHAAKRREFLDAAERQCLRARRDAEAARRAHLGAFMFGELLLLVALGGVALAGALLTGVGAEIRAGFVVVLLYLIGPVKSLLAAAPLLLQARLAWRRLAAFSTDAPAPERRPAPGPVVHSLELRGVTFQYEHEDGRGLRVGPVDLSVSRGECVFLTGGNGSGKTTLAKVLCGLYAAQSGEIKIDGRSVPREELGEHFAVVFSPCFVFKRLYGVAATDDEVAGQLERMGLTGAGPRGGAWVDAARLSSGQRKRAALVESCLQGRPILLFDEAAADQDTEFRRFFYGPFLAELRRAGKIVIAITHDEQFFHVADRVVKLDLGRVATTLMANVPSLAARSEPAALAAPTT